MNSSISVSGVACQGDSCKVTKLPARAVLVAGLGSNVTPVVLNLEYWCRGHEIVAGELLDQRWVAGCFERNLVVGRFLP